MGLSMRQCCSRLSLTLNPRYESATTLRHHLIEPRCPRVGECHHPRIRCSPSPAAIIDVIEQRRTEGAGEVVPALAPVEAGAAKGASAACKGIEVDSHIGKES